LETQGKSPSPGVAPGGNVFQRKDIRVDMDKLDKLFELTGELITAETMVVQHPELRNLDLNGFESAASYLTKITRQMQEITMTVRMIPLEGLFNKMRRLVRDLSKKFDKNVLMEVSGQETEMDRNVIEQISDPLVHVMRNSIDHGIEDGATRVAAGKPKEGRLQLNAKYEGNEIWITIKDDGKGLSREKILAKAEERGMLKGDEENRPDEDIWKMIFEPGFSTAAQVSDVSGRGVGMDVVRRNIEKLKGKISVTSKTGEGTEIILKIPLTLAIMDGISVKVGNCNYAMALGDILEFHKATEGQVVNTDGRHSVLKLRDELMPIIKLHEFYEIDTKKKEVTDGILIITNSNNRKAAVLVDDIIGYQQIVVKSLPGYIGSIRAVSGCSIMGDGEVSLIIDMGSLLKEELDEVAAKIH
jgi:two-component system chemotaxis sensor kinase CheA